MRYNVFATLLTAVALLPSCSKWLELDTPQNQLTLDKVFRDSTTAESAVLDIYAYMERSLAPNFIFPISLYGDELTYNGSSEDYVEFADGNVSADNRNNQSIWTNFYSIIYKCNDALENLSEGNETWTDRLVGEASFLRAFSYFYLLNLYGNIPLVLQTDAAKTSTATQARPEAVYEQIFMDLELALGLLPIARDEQVSRVSRDAVLAMMARVYLASGEWELARAKSEELILSNRYRLLDHPGNVFKRGSNEAIFQLWTKDGFTATAGRFVPADAASIPQFLLSDHLFQLFDPADVRKKDWVGVRRISSTPDSVDVAFRAKYRNTTANNEDAEYLMVLRLAEVYLIRAEANMNLGNGSDALDDLNAIRKRGGMEVLEMEDIEATTLGDLIFAERQRELFAEWGHGFLDLKRTAKLKNLPIPEDELLYNPNLIQNKD